MDTDTVSVDVARAQEETLIDDLCQREATIAMQEQELGLLRKVEQAARGVVWGIQTIETQVESDLMEALEDATVAVAEWRAQHARVTP